MGFAYQNKPDVVAAKELQEGLDHYIDTYGEDKLAFEVPYVGQLKAANEQLKAEIEKLKHEKNVLKMWGK